MIHVCSGCGKEQQANARFCHWCGTPLGSSSLTGLLPPQTSLNAGRYIIIERVGQGGMGAVYKALDTHMQSKVVAIKEMSQSRLSAQEFENAIAAFTHEAEMLARLEHSALPHIYQQFTENARHYLVMEFIAGETVEQRHDTYRRRGELLPLGQILGICLQLCDVLEYLHTQQPPVIFRDLKPSNIMLAPSGRVYLIDFGIARLFKPDQDKDTTSFGTLGYAAPEQYRESTSPRSDIYSLGAILHQLLTGHDPSQSPLQFKPFSLHMPDLETLVMSMVDSDIQSRPASALAVREALEKIARDVLRKKNGTMLTRTAPEAKNTTPKKQTLFYIIISPATRDQQLWASIQDQLLSQLPSFFAVRIYRTSRSSTPRANALLEFVDHADLILCLLSPDFLASPLYMAIADKAIERAETTDTKAFSALLRPCAWQNTPLARLRLASPDVIEHNSLYAQKLRVLALAENIQTVLATMLLTGNPTGKMPLSQWLLWQLYGSGRASCPFFATGRYTLSCNRPPSRAGLRFSLFDHQAGHIVTEYTIKSLTNISIAELVRTIASSAASAEEIQGLAQREQPPSHLTQPTLRELSAERMRYQRPI